MGEDHGTEELSDGSDGNSVAAARMILFAAFIGLGLLVGAIWAVVG